MINRESGIHHATYEKDTAFFRVPLAKVAIIAVVVLAFLIPLVATDWWLGAILLPWLIFTIGVIGLNLMAGYTGQFSLGHAAFMGIGGYTAVVFSAHGFPFLWNVVAGGIGGAIAGLLFGLPTARIKGLYLLMATMAAQFLLPWLTARLIPHLVPPGVIIGGGGDTVSPAPTMIFGWHVNTLAEEYYVALVMLILATVFAMNLVRSRIGRAWVAIRDHDVAARILGINIFRYKLLSFAVGCFYAGIAGALLVFLFYGVAHVDEFHFGWSLRVLGAVIIGGMGSMIGSFFGTGFIVVFPFMLNRALVALADATGLPITLGIITGIEFMVFGALMIIFLVFEPHGLAKIYQNFKDYFRLWPFSY